MATSYAPYPFLGHELAMVPHMKMCVEMAIDIYPRVEEALKTKQRELTEFLETAPATEKQICLC